MKGLSKTGIEYGQFSWNPYPGCLHKQQGKCPLPNCWAEGMSKRKREDFHKPHLIPERLLSPLSRKKPARILVNFMGDLMGDWVEPETKCGHLIPKLDWRVAYEKTNDIIATSGLEAFGRLGEIVHWVCNECPQHQFFFLTKNPAGYAKWGEWPENAWLGATAWDRPSFTGACCDLKPIKCAHRWLSIEPLLSWHMEKHYVEDVLNLSHTDWVVIGGQSAPKLMPGIEWVKQIVEACDAAGVRVWLKENLYPLFRLPDIPNGYRVPKWAHGIKGINNLRQELP